MKINGFKLLYLLHYIINKFIRLGEMYIIEKNLKDVSVEKSNMAIEYKWLNKNDISQITTLNHLSANKVENYFNNGAKCLAAYVDGMLAGYVWYHTRTYKWPFFDYEIDCKESPHIGPDFVSVNFRGKHLHGSLLCLVFQELSSKGYQYALSSVWKNNLSSIKGLIRVGFYPVRSILAIRLMNKLIYKRIKEISRWPSISH